MGSFKKILILYFSLFTFYSQAQAKKVIKIYNQSEKEVQIIASARDEDSLSYILEEGKKIKFVCDRNYENFQLIIRDIIDRENLNHYTKTYMTLIDNSSFDPQQEKKIFIKSSNNSLEITYETSNLPLEEIELFDSEGLFKAFLFAVFLTSLF